METSTDYWHGTRTGYNGRACRCEDCREAQRVYQRELTQKRSLEQRARNAAYMKQWRLNNLERERSKARARRAENLEKYKTIERMRAERLRGDPIYLARQRDRRYSLREGQFDEMLTTQANRCAICRAEFDDSSKPHVDHDHACCPGQNSCGACIRGLLCSGCNTGIGSLGDDVDRLRSAISYLTR